MSNMKQLNPGLLAYVQDYDELFPCQKDNGGNSYSYHSYTTPGGTAATWDVLVLPYTKNAAILTCPDDQVYAGNVNEYAEAMRNGIWDWARTASDPTSPMIKDAAGNILAGHHRFVAAEAAGVKIPKGVVRIIPGSGERVPHPWDQVTVLPGYRS